MTDAFDFVLRTSDHKRNYYTLVNTSNAKHEKTKRLSALVTLSCATHVILFVVSFSIVVPNTSN